jgi:PKD repeat protein
MEQRRNQRGARMRSTGPLHHWLDKHPTTAHIDVARSVQRGQQLYRRWLIVRTVVAVALGVGIFAVTAALRTGGSTAAGPLTAQLDVQPSSGTAPLTVTADGSTSTPAAGSKIVSYEFDFNDRGGLTEPQEQPTAGWMYRRSGTYTVTLTVTDANGTQDRDRVTVTVRDRPTADPTALPGPGRIREPAKPSSGSNGNPP